MVNIAGTLPKGGGNGLEAHSAALAKALVGGQRFFAVGVVVTDSVKTKADLDPVPTIKFNRIELVPFEHELEAAAAELLQAAGALRDHGQQAFDFAKSEGSAPAEPAGPAELDAGGGMYFRVVDVEPGVFELRLCSQYVEGLLTRTLHRSEWGEVPPGDYQAGQFDMALSVLASNLLVEWSTNGGDAEIVDAEIVEDDERAEDEPDVDEGTEGGDSE